MAASSACRTLAALWGASLLILLPIPSPAQVSADAVTQAAFEVVELEAFVEANALFCAEAAPDAAGVAKRAADQWHAVNAMRLMWSWADVEPEIAASFAIARMARRDEIARDLAGRAGARTDEWCRNLPALLQGPEWDVGAAFPTEVATILALGAQVLGADAAVPIERGRWLPEVASPPLAEAAAAGWNPETMPLPGEYRCYEEAADSADHADLLVQITGIGTYASTLGDGSWGLDEDGDFAWTSGPLAEASSYPELGDHGARFSLDGVERGGAWLSFECRRAGAADAALAVSARLATPQVGPYACTDAATGDASTLEILPYRQYRFRGQEGVYTLRDVVGDGSAFVEWITGPFAGGTSFYAEEEGTGLRDLAVSTSEGGAVGGFVHSSSALSLSCEAVGEPVAHALYGPDPAPDPTPGTQAIEGRFLGSETVFNGTFSAEEPRIYAFHPDGHVLIGAPGPGVADDCARTRPNGMPVCDTYQVLGNQIELTVDGERETLPFAMEGGVPMIDGEPMRPVVPSAETTLDGVWWANDYYGFGFCGGEFSSCTSSYQEWTYAFSPDGRFSYAEEGQSLASMSTAIASTNVGSNRSDADQGTYRIDGNTITFTHANGVTRSLFFFRDAPEGILIGDELFTPKED